MKGKKEPHRPWKNYLALGIILLVTLVSFLPTLQNGFVWDDQYYIISNSLLKPVNLTAIFSQNVGGNYHPLTILVLAAEFHLFGLHETGYHAVSILLHLLNVILVFYAVFLLSEKAGIALVAALLFGIHPMHVESVAWVSERKDLLYTFFFLASYIFYLRYTGTNRKKYLAFALGLFLLSLLSKAMAASLPVLLILTDYYKGRAVNMRSLLEKAPFFLLALIFGVVAILAQKSSNYIQDSSVFTFPQRIVFACYGFVTYLWKLLLPLHLSAYYPYPQTTGGQIPGIYFACLILFLAIAAAVIYSLRQTRKIFFGLGFFSITLFLVLQLLPVGGAIMADRYSYLPSIGIFFLAGEGLFLLWNKKQPWAVILLLGVFTVFFSVTTYARCSVWKNGQTLWSDVIGQYQAIPQAYHNRGLYLMNHGQWDEALSDFDKAIQLDPNHVEAYNNRGNIYMNNNMDDKALSDFNKAIELKPGFAKAYYNRGIVLMKQKRYDQSLNDYNKAIELKMDDMEIYINKGYIFMTLGRYEEAIASYSRAIELNPGYTDAYYNRGLAEYYAQKKSEACLDMKLAASRGSKPAADAIPLVCN
ncbi:MAG: tetratricopeptide repeat protein [Bacteroidales bacterium]